MTIGPAPVLALLVGFLHACLFVVFRGTGGRRFVVIVGAAVLGAWTGDAIAGRLDLDPVRLGDFHLAASSLVAWLGIALVVTMSALAPAARRAPGDLPGSFRLEVRRRRPDLPPDGSDGPGSPTVDDPDHGAREP